MAKRKEKATARKAPRRVIAFKIDDDLRAQLKARAAAQDRNVSSMITHYIKVGLGLSTPVGANDNT